ncbi:MAG: GNAT family N-acetyltransferase [Flavihumibacter sp.]|nr:GNAT family N-acetyltransferase [Flavihumibacter sp.]
MITIKKAGIEDMKALVPLFDAYRVFYKKASDQQAATNFLKERLQKEESVIFIAYLNDTAVGFTQLYPIFSSVSMQRAWLLNDLYTNEAARKKGVATALLNHAKNFGSETNSKYLMLQTAADNKTAQKVYEQNGWQKETDWFYAVSLPTAL